MHHDTMTAGGGRSLWRWAATFAMLLALIGGSFTQVAAATPTNQAGQHDAKPTTQHPVAPHSATATGIAAQGGGTVASWGDNNDLYFCDGDYSYSDVLAPRTNPNLSGVTAVAAGGDHALYLLSDGTVYSCGYNEFGLLGIGNTDNNDYGTPQQVLGVCPSPSPVPASGGTVAPATPAHSATECGHLSNIKAIAAGGYELSLALDTSGNVYAWGDNRYGELGTGIADNSGPEVCDYSTSNDEMGGPNYYSEYRSCSTTPVRVPGLTNVVQIVVGDSFAAALRADGSVYAWGANYDAQLAQADTGPQQCMNTFTDGNGNTTPYDSNSCSAAPVVVAGLPVIAQIITGMDSDHMLALDTTGHVWAWGYNRNGELGRGFTSPNEPTPAQVLGLGGAADSVLSTVAQPDPARPYIERIGVAYDTSYAVLTDGTVAAWGYNYYGDLGIGNTMSQPTEPVGGCNNNGNSCYTYPVQVHGVDNVGLLGNIAGLGSGGDDTAYAITTDGRLYAWGYNGYGNLGIGVEGSNSGPGVRSADNSGNTDKYTPVAVLSTKGQGQLSNVLAVSASDDDWAIALIAAPVAPVQQYTVTASVTGSGTVTPTGTTSYDANTNATYSAAAATGQTFTGWTLDGAYVGYANPLTLTVAANRTLVATFVATPTFSDLGPLSAADRQMITFLAARGIINPAGVNGSGQFQPGGDVARAEIAAFIARTFGWETEFHANTFPDRCAPTNATNCIDAKLWNDVAALKDYGVVGGYTDPATCQSGGTTAPCYLPRDGVQRVQVVSIVARAFIKTPDLRPTGFWDRLAANASQDTNVSTEGTQRSDLTTYRANAGELPGQGDSATFANPTFNSTRLFVIQVLYQAYNAQFGVDRVP